MRRPILRLALALALTLVGLPGMARQVTDQLGRTVELPDQVERAVVLQHQALNLAVQLGATDKLVGILDEWRRQLGARYVRLAPRLDGMAVPGGLAKVNIEELLRLDPDVVLVTHYAPPEMIQQITAAGVPVVGVAFCKASSEEAAKLNATLADEGQAYEEGFPEPVRLIPLGVLPALIGTRIFAILLRQSLARGWADGRAGRD